MTAADAAQDRADLSIDVYTTPGRPIVSATPPGGPDDQPTWSPMSATLIYGDEDAILVDAWATYDQADALADWIETKGRRLSRVYITHGHGDHWLGLARPAQRPLSPTMALPLSPCCRSRGVRSAEVARAFRTDNRAHPAGCLRDAGAAIVNL